MFFRGTATCFRLLNRSLLRLPNSSRLSATMPPKKHSDKMKRKASPLSEEADDSQSNKKAKVDTSHTESQYPAQPTNLVLPIKIELSRPAEGITRIATWNICGLAASQRKGFKFYVEAEDPDILLLTETKVNNIPVDPNLDARFPYRYWSIASKKGYSGTAILSKHKPLNVRYDLPDHPDSDIVKGRLITLEFENLFLVGTYVPNAGQNLQTLPIKEEWNKYFEKYICTLDSSKPVIWAGDLNVAPTSIDLTHDKKNWNKTPGYTASETGAFARILSPPASEDEAENLKLVDVWRERHPGWPHYTYFSYRFKCREKGIGWRLDMFVVSERLLPKVKECEIRSAIYGASDHCPVILDLDLSGHL